MKNVGKHHGFSKTEIERVCHWEDYTKNNNKAEILQQSSWNHGYAER